jgi:PPOX class probable F420-dependent enzyme
MLTDNAKAAVILDRDLIGFLTAVNEKGQPQTAPVWFLRDDDDLVVYNRPTSPRLTSLASNPMVSFCVRGDIRAAGALILEGRATVGGLPPAVDLPAYVAKYEREIERLGWTPETFSDMYSEGARITVTRVWAWGLDALGEG